MGRVITRTKNWIGVEPSDALHDEIRKAADADGGLSMRAWLLKIAAEKVGKPHLFERPRAGRRPRPRQIA